MRARRRPRAAASPRCGPANWAAPRSSSVTTSTWSATCPARTDTLARIVRRGQRRTLLRRTADDTDPTERVVVANADQLLIVVALADPPPRTGLVDRTLIAAYAGGLTPILCLTKTDLAPAEPFAEQFADLDLTVITAGRDDPLDAVAHLLAGKITVLLGHSGVGKSTLVNRLVPRSASSGRRGHRHRPGPAHLDAVGGAAARRRRLGDRHPGDPLVRAGPHRTRRRGAGVLRPGRSDRGLPARLRASGAARRSRMRAGRP